MATCGEALASNAVQHEGAVVEVRSMGWWVQYRVGRYGTEAHGYNRMWLGVAWGAWDVAHVALPMLALPARVLLRGDADGSPEERGPVLPEASPDPAT